MNKQDYFELTFPKVKEDFDKKPTPEVPENDAKELKSNQQEQLPQEKPDIIKTEDNIPDVPQSEATSDNTDNPQIEKDSAAISDTLDFKALLKAQREDSTSNSGTGMLNHVQMPLFMNGDFRKFSSWFFHNFKMPEETSLTYQERVIVQFLVNKNGDVTNINILECSNNNIRNEIERVMLSSPKWVPAKRKGWPLNVSFQMPINFKSMNSQ